MKKHIQKLLLALIVAITAAALVACSSIEGDYEDAQALMAKGDYAAAASAFKELGSYEDASTLAMYCSACAEADRGNYEAAIAALASMGDYKDCVMRMTYYKGRACEAAAGTADWTQMEKAQEHYRSIPFFLDSSERISALSVRAEAARAACYDAAVAAAESGRYQEADDRFTSLGSYRDSQMRWWYYAFRDHADSATRQNDPDDMYLASTRYSRVAGFLDYDQRVAALLAHADSVVAQRYAEIDQLIADDQYDAAQAKLATFSTYGSERVPQKYYAIGEAHATAGEWELAAAAFLKASPSSGISVTSDTSISFAYPSDAYTRYLDAWRSRAEELMAAGEWQAASGAFRTAELYSRINEPFYRQGEALMVQGDLDGALAAYRKAGSFSDARSRVTYCGLLMEENALTDDGDQDARIALSEKYVALGGLMDSADRAAELQAEADAIVAARYAEIDRLTAAGRPGDAVALLSVFGTYGSDKVPEKYYAAAMKHRHAGEWEQSLSAFACAGSYSDAPARLLETHYLQGEAHLAAGNPADAIVSFQAAFGHPGAAEKTAELHRLFRNHLASSVMAFAAVRADGTVLSTLPGTEDMRGVIDVAIRKESHYDGVEYHVIALHADGTLSGTDSVPAWENVADIDCRAGRLTALHTDGTVSNTFRKLPDWKNVIAIAEGGEHTIALMADGTVAASGGSHLSAALKVSDWTDIVDVAAGSTFSAGLKKDGTVVMTGAIRRLNTDSWTDVIDIEATSTAIYGLKADGTILQAGGSSRFSWSGVVDIVASESTLMGLRADGSVLVSGSGTSAREAAGWNLCTDGNPSPINRVNTENQEKAMSFLSRGQWAEAAAAFNSARSLSSWQAYIAYCQLRMEEEALDASGDQDALIALAQRYASLGSLLDCPDRAQALTGRADAIVADRCTRADELIALGDAQAVHALLAAFGEYGSAQVPGKYYALGERMRTDGAWVLAIQSYDQAGDVTDAAQRSAYCQLRQDEEALTSTDHQDELIALAQRYTAMGSLLDCAERAQSLTSRADAIVAERCARVDEMTASGEYARAEALLQGFGVYGSDCIPLKRYAMGEHARTAGLWEDANAAYTKAGRYEDAVRRAAYCALRIDEDALQDTDDQDALIALAGRYAAMGSVLDSADRAAGLTERADGIVREIYARVDEMIAASQYDQAHSVLDSFRKYGSNRIPEMRFSIGEHALAAGQWNAAASAYEQAGSYADAQSMGDYITLRRSEEALEATTDADALMAIVPLYAAQSGLRDCSQRAADLTGRADNLVNQRYGSVDALTTDGQYAQAMELLARAPQYRRDEALARYYAIAARLQSEGRPEDAARIFSMAGDHADARARSAEMYLQAGAQREAHGDYAAAMDNLQRVAGHPGVLARQQELTRRFNGLIAAGYSHTIAITADGHVTGAGNSSYRRSDLDAWQNVAAIATSDALTLALQPNGRVLASSSNTFSSAAQVSGWTDVVAIAVGGSFSAGLRRNGTIVTAGSDTYNRPSVPTWTDVVAITARDYDIAALRRDGTVVSDGIRSYNTQDWQGIVAIGLGNTNLYGLRTDGTVVAIGQDLYVALDVGDWRDIVGIAAGGSHVVGLRADGTVVAAGSDRDGQCRVSDWTGIIAIFAGDNHTLGLKADGTVVATGQNISHQCEVASWDLIPDSYQQGVALMIQGAWAEAAGQLSSCQAYGNTAALLAYCAARQEEASIPENAGLETLCAMADHYRAVSALLDAADRAAGFTARAESIITAQLAQAEQLIVAGQYTQAEALLSALQPFAAQRTEERYYAIAEHALAQGLWDKASQSFHRAGSHADALKRINEPYYQQAESLLALGLWDEAADAFRRAGSYSNAAVRVSDTYYRKANAQMEEGLWTEAEATFTTIRSYADAQERITYCGLRRNEEALEDCSDPDALVSMANRYRACPDLLDCTGRADSLIARADEIVALRYAQVDGLTAAGQTGEALAILNAFGRYGSESIPDKHYAIGEKYLEDGSWNKAILLFATLGKHPGASDRLLYAHLRQEEDALAESSDPDALMSLAERYSATPDLLDCSGRAAGLTARANGIIAQLYAQVDEFTAAGEYGQAEAILASFGSYGSEGVTSKRYAMGESALASGLWAEAGKAYTLCGEHLDAPGMVLYCAIRADEAALAADAAPEVLTALADRYTALDSLRDSAGRALTLNERAAALVNAMMAEVDTLIDQKQYAEAETLMGNLSSGYASQLPPRYYRIGQAFLEAGDYAGAARFFHRAPEQPGTMENLRAIHTHFSRRFSIGPQRTVALLASGEVAVAGRQSAEGFDASVWQNIVAINTMYATAGVKADGTVVMADEDPSFHSSSYTAGLNTVYRTTLRDLKDVVSVQVGKDFMIALKADGTIDRLGTISSVPSAVYGWSDLVAIEMDGNLFAGLTSEGTVLVYRDKNAPKLDERKWHDIVQINVPSYSITGLRADGTVVTSHHVHNAAEQEVINGWTNVVAVASGYSHCVGLLADGTVVAAGSNSSGQCDVSAWTDVIAIAAGSSQTLGLRADGTLLATGWNSDGQLDVGSWNLISEEYRTGLHQMMQEEWADAAASFASVLNYGDARSLHAYCLARVDEQALIGQSDVQAHLALAARYAAVSHVRDAADRAGALNARADALIAAELAAADQLIAGASYGEAATLLHSMKPYADGLLPEKYYAMAEHALSTGEWDASADAFRLAGGYSNAASRINEPLYFKAAELLEQGLWDDARTVFQALGDYSDAKIRIREAHYREGDALLEKQLWSDAYNAFKQAGTYSDASKMLTYCNMRRDEAALEGSSDPDALIALASRYRNQSRLRDCKDRADSLLARADEIVALRYARVDELTAAGQYDEALAILDSFSVHGNQDVAAKRYAIGERLLAEGSWDGAISLFAALGSHPGAAESLLYAGLRQEEDALAESNDPDALIALARRYSTDSAPFDSADRAAQRYARVDELTAAGQYAQAEAILAAFGSYGSEGVTCKRYAIGEHALSAGHWAEASAAYALCGEYLDAPAMIAYCAIRGDEAALPADATMEALTGMADRYAALQPLRDCADRTQALTRRADAILDTAMAEADALIALGDIPGARAILARYPGYEQTLDRLYAIGERYLSVADYPNAALAFQQACSHPDALAQLQAIQPRFRKLIAVGRDHVLCLNTDGTVSASSKDSLASLYGYMEVEEWTDVVAIDATQRSYAVTADGTVMKTDSRAFSSDEIRTDELQGVCDVAAGDYFLAGLTPDGTVLASGSVAKALDLSDFHDLSAISAGPTHLVGLRTDGSVVVTRHGTTASTCNTASWRDIVAIDAGPDFIIGLKADGTVLLTGANSSRYTDSGWSDIVAIAAGNEHVVGLKADGTVLARAAGRDSFGVCKVSTWKNVIAIYAGGYQTIGLQADGTLLIAGKSSGADWDLFPNAYQAACNRMLQEDWAGAAQLLSSIPGFQSSVDIASLYAYCTARDSEKSLSADADHKALHSVAALYEAANGVLDSGDRLQRLLGQAEERILHLMSQAEAMIADASLTQAEALLDDVAVSDPQRAAGGYYALAEKHLTSGDAAAALSAFGKAGSHADAPTRISAIHYSLGEEHIAHARWEDARSAFLMATLHPLSASMADYCTCRAEEDGLTDPTQEQLTALAARYSALSDPPDAALRAQTLTQQAEELSAARLVRIDDMISSGLYDEAEAIISSLSDGQAEKYLLLGDHAAENGDYGTAFHAYRQCSHLPGVMARLTALTTHCRQYIAAGNSCTVGLQADGHVLASSRSGNPEFLPVSSWQDIVAISVTHDVQSFVGLRSDGTVLCANVDKASADAISSWRDVTAVAIGSKELVIGVRSDGTVVVSNAAFNRKHNTSHWQNVVSVAAGADFVVGLRADGTVVAAGSVVNAAYDVSTWRNIVAIDAGNDFAVALCADGTVLATDHNTSYLSDVVAIHGEGNRLLSLKADGTVMSSLYIDNSGVLRNWTNVISIQASDTTIFALLADGTVISDNGYFFISSWQDVIAIDASKNIIVGLRADGSVVVSSSIGPLQELQTSAWDLWD